MKHTLVFHLIGLSKKFQKAIGQNSGTSPLSYTQATTLLIIDSLPFANQSEIAKRLHLQPATIVTLIDELEKQALVRRNPTPNDRRTYQILLTDMGKKELEAIKRKSKSIEKFVKNQLSSHEFELLTAIVDKLTKSLDETQSNVKKTNKKGGVRWTIPH